MSVRGKGVSINPQRITRFLILFRLIQSKVAIGAFLIFGFEIP